ncbi:Spermatogenesis-associated protein 22 [Holothuria leucospilota]|uniref:Spermatogenesis-associated protein 22 n=1 Tax=Holothuria leucospilota TaxID=206669 RepID=A0A9Q1HE20_HOLLE|nr:Spermatogenesis-associated protein 22 [Holothuria leucospilota]
MQSQNSYNINVTNSINTGQKILPIFNVRKRPRQALYAVPSTLSQEAEKKPSIQLQPCLPPRQVAQAEIKGDWKKSSNSFHNLGGTSHQQPVTSNTGKGAFQKYVGANQAGTRKIQPAKLLGTNQQETTSAGSYPSPSRNYSAKNNQTTQLVSNSSMSTSNYVTPSSSSFSQNLSRKSVVPQRKSSNFQRPEEQPVTTQVKATSNDRVQGEDFKQNEKSMKVLTVGIEGVRKWSQILAGDGMLMFEVFARKNSIVSSNEGNNAKLFTLQDGNHTLRCIFYETDRSLPQVQKGQMVRCLGSFQVTQNIFHCVAIRIVSPTEQRWMKVQISACDKALRSELAVIKIEP